MSDSDLTPRPVKSSPRRIRLRIISVFVVLGIALVFLLVEGLGSSLNYFDTVQQALSKKTTLGTSVIRLEGVVVAGSIHSTSVGTDFEVSEGRQQVPVVNVGSPPQLFQVGIPVVVVGHFASASSMTFLSNQIMVKHSSNYAPASAGSSGQASQKKSSNGKNGASRASL